MIIRLLQLEMCAASVCRDRVARCRSLDTLHPVIHTGPATESQVIQRQYRKWTISKLLRQQYQVLAVSKLLNINKGNGQSPSYSA